MGMRLDGAWDDTKIGNRAGDVVLARVLEMGLRVRLGIILGWGR